MWETKFMEHSPGNRSFWYVLYKTLLTQDNFVLNQLKMHLLIALTVYTLKWTTNQEASGSSLAGNTYHLLTFSIAILCILSN